MLCVNPVLLPRNRSLRLSHRRLGQVDSGVLLETARDRYETRLLITTVP